MSSFRVDDRDLLPFRVDSHIPYTVLRLFLGRNIFRQHFQSEILLLAIKILIFTPKNASL